MNKGRVIAWTVLILIGLGIGGFFAIRSMVRANKVKPFKEELASYLEGTKMPGGMEPTAKTPIQGKLITVDLDSRDIDYLSFDLPDDLRAETPAEVGTVVQLNWGKVQVGQYNSSPAYRQTCNVTVKDKATGKHLYQQGFMGSEPPGSISSKSSEGSGSKPTEQVIKFLQSLPHK